MFCILCKKDKEEGQRFPYANDPIEKIFICKDCQGIIISKEIKKLIKKSKKELK